MVETASIHSGPTLTACRDLTRLAMSNVLARKRPNVGSSFSTCCSKLTYVHSTHLDDFSVYQDQLHDLRVNDQNVFTPDAEEPRDTAIWDGTLDHLPPAEAEPSESSEDTDTVVARKSIEEGMAGIVTADLEKHESKKKARRKLGLREIEI